MSKLLLTSIKNVHIIMFHKIIYIIRTLLYNHKNNKYQEGKYFTIIRVDFKIETMFKFRLHYKITIERSIVTYLPSPNEL